MTALRVWWLTQVPNVAKQVMSALGGVVTTLALVGVVFDIPNQVDASTKANQRQDGEIAALQAAQVEDVRLRAENERNVGYLTCLVEVLAEVPGKSALACGNERIRSGQ